MLNTFTITAAQLDLISSVILRIGENDPLLNNTSYRRGLGLTLAGVVGDVVRKPVLNAVQTRTPKGKTLGDVLAENGNDVGKAIKALIAESEGNQHFARIMKFADQAFADLRAEQPAPSPAKASTANVIVGGFASKKPEPVKKPEKFNDRGAAHKNRLSNEHAARLSSLIAQFRDVDGMNLTQIAKALNKRGLRTITGRLFNHATVGNVISRLTGMSTSKLDIRKAA